MQRRDFLLGTGAAGLAAFSLRGRRAAFATDRPHPPARPLVLMLAVGAARVGATNQIVDLLGDPPPDPPTPPLPATEESLLQRYAAASVERARATRGATGYNRRRVDDFADAAARSQRLLQLRTRF